MMQCCLLAYSTRLGLLARSGSSRQGQVPCHGLTCSGPSTVGVERELRFTKEKEKNNGTQNFRRGKSANAYEDGC